MKWLTGTSPYIEIPLGNGLFGHVNSLPMVFESPMSFEDPSTASALDVEEDLVAGDLDEGQENEAEIPDEQTD